MKDVVVTLALDDDSFQWLEGLRQEHYPRKHNLVPAHITLFHRLPADDGLAALAAQVAPFTVTLGPAVRQGKGVALQVSGLIDDRLIPKDRGPFQPHATIQSKVTETHARATMALLALELPASPRAARAVGLHVWRYDDGPWTHVALHPFGGPG